ncbi:MAG: hypothetical protein AAB352_01635 [Patescibacteria group bacterium]
MTWIDFYNFLGIKDFIYFISNPSIQDMLFPVKLVFVSFAMFFLAAVVYFMMNSSWLKFKFLEDVTEFFSWQAYGLKEISRRWSKIQKRMDIGAESEYKLAIIEADDFLAEMLGDRDFTGKTPDDLIKNAGSIIVPNMEKVLEARKIRNSIVYDPDFKIDQNQAKNILVIYEAAIKNVGSS